MSDSKRVTVTLPPEIADRIPFDDYDSDSKAVLAVIEDGLEIEELRARADHAEARKEELRRQLKAERTRRDDVGELVEYVETTRALERAEAERRRAKEHASIIKRAKWWLAGTPDDLGRADNDE